MRQHEEPQDLSPTGLAKLRELVEGMAAHQPPISTAGGTGSTIASAPATEMEQLVVEALHFMYEHHLIIPFDWAHWEEGRALFTSDAPNQFTGLDRLTVLKLLTLIARNDRFTPGAWAEIFANGDGLFLLQRLLDLETNPPDLA